VVILRSWRAAAVLVVVLTALACGVSRASAGEPSAIGAIERGFAGALGKAEKTQLLRYVRHRTRPPESPAAQVVWVDLVTGQRRELDYDASGHLTSGSSSAPESALPAGENLDGACGCDLDPFTNFPEQALHIALVGDQTIDGKQAIHLRFTVTGGNEPSVTDFWIDRVTYLPVRSKVAYRARANNGRLGPIMTTSDRFTWLPRTSANLAHLASG
jgi:hypothetical protein